MRQIIPCLLLAFALAGCSSDTTTTHPTTAPTTSGSTSGQGTVTGVTIDAPKAPSGGSSEVCWHVAGAGNVAHVAIHWDTQSHAAKTDRTFADYAAGAAYPGNSAQLNAAGYDLPGDFCANVATPSSGALYIVGHAIDRSGAPGRLSTEVVLPSSAAPTAGLAQAPAIVSIPASAPAGSMATVCWTISGTGTVPHTAIHWDTETHATASPRTFTLYDAGASYPGNQSQANPSGYTLQATGSRFCTAATMPASGSVFVVAHVIDSTGAPGKVSEEKEIRVGAAPAGATLTIRGFAFVPGTLSAAPGATVSVTNEDSTKHTATGTGFDTGDIQPGATRTFTAPSTPGDYPVSCAYHSSMHATLHVA
ncbi:MAG: hypothetical protein ABR562_08105 [Thermoplasmatota archaeon]